MIPIKTKILLWLMKSDSGKKVRKIAMYSLISVLLIVILIPVALIEAINPFKSNAYLISDAERALRANDVYKLALDDIRRERSDDALSVNLDLVRIFEYFVVFDTKQELYNVSQDVAKQHLIEYYIYQEEKEVTNPTLDENGNEIIDDETGEAQHEVKTITINKAKSLEQILKDLSTDYPVLLNEDYALQIINIYDFQKNVTRQKIHGGGTGNPVDSECFVYYSPFGEYLEGGAHHGVDLSGERGTPIMAVADGIIKEIVNTYEDSPVGLSFEEALNFYGKENYIMIEHDVAITSGSNYKTRYMHMTRWDNLPYKVGDEVKQGEIIGYMGNSGFSTGYHLHFETWIDGKRVDPITFYEFGQLRDTTNYIGCGY